MNYAAFADELDQPMLKQALIERLVRLGATDVEDLPGIRHLIKSSPRLFMRKRSRKSSMAWSRASQARSIGSSSPS